MEKEGRKKRERRKKNQVESTLCVLFKEADKEEQTCWHLARWSNNCRCVASSAFYFHNTFDMTIISNNSGRTTIAGVAYAPETLLTSHIVIGIGRARIRLRARNNTDWFMPSTCGRRHVYKCSYYIRRNVEETRDPTDAPETLLTSSFDRG